MSLPHSSKNVRVCLYMLYCFLSWPHNLFQSFPNIPFCPLFDFFPFSSLFAPFSLSPEFSFEKVLRKIKEKRDRSAAADRSFRRLFLIPGRICSGCSSPYYSAPRLHRTDLPAGKAAARRTHRRRYPQILRREECCRSRKRAPGSPPAPIP